SLMVAWQDIPWKHIHRHVFRLQKRIYRATENAGARDLSPAGYACQASGHRGAECTETGTLRSGAAVGGAIRLLTVTSLDGWGTRQKRRAEHVSRVDTTRRSSMKPLLASNAWKTMAAVLAGIAVVAMVGCQWQMVALDQTHTCLPRHHRAPVSQTTAELHCPVRQCPM